MSLAHSRRQFEEATAWEKVSRSADTAEPTRRCSPPWTPKQYKRTV